MENLETKIFGGRILEHKEMTINGVPVGVIKGHIAAWGPDTGGKYGIPDRFHKGAFLASLQEHRDRGNRQIRLKDMHGRVIGGFPIETAKEDDVGLWAEGHVNLDTQLGREAFSLIKQGVLEDLSIGFNAMDDKIDGGFRNIYKANVWEGSIVDEPAHRGAQIVEWKSAIPFQDLPLAERTRPWNADEAKQRLRDVTCPGDVPTPGFKEAFLWHDPTHPDDFASYQMPIADVIEGKVMEIPRGIMDAAGSLREEKAGVPTDDVPKVICHLERYYAKMNMDSPWDPEERRFVGHDEVKAMGHDELELALRTGVAFSKAAAREVMMRMDPEAPEEKACYDQGALSALHENLVKLRRSLK